MLKLFSSICLLLFLYMKIQMNSTTPKNPTPPKNPGISTSFDVKKSPPVASTAMRMNMVCILCNMVQK